MRNFYSNIWRRVLIGLAMTCSLPASAECTRDIIVPLSPIGASVVVNGTSVSGIYPELLRNIGAKVGCNLVFSAVPRARLEAMFETGKADVLIPAISTPRRDQQGWFVPLLGHRPMLLSVQSSRPAITSVQDLIERRDIRVALVRGYDYGDAYQALAKELLKQGRLFYEVDTLSVARLMQGGFVDATIMGPTMLAGTAQNDARVQGLVDKLRVEALPELPWGSSGAYISRKSLKPEDQAQLRELLEKMAKSNALLESFQRHHRSEFLTTSIRPR
ncbi:substrate-binding periplasmic protein [Janthinobacterium agaricidamnosum]|uniref:Solute-binding protein family 3/N-terminal domain-containing protein n=1 Tax=Janthinobacterium agaricidamnosum NBRC 102515 = DSM 9628 TaxID=1349767 RepID=W0V5T0_9BURK|nr:transporter substrate-binding domain-containing protein [Janthinobacterium agaricidamnosum]CDG82622.1 putative uncharacterized protein [Janthinobacterium agaricidamnosum NBRC 102515 = DSM 9628]